MAALGILLLLAALLFLQSFLYDRLWSKGLEVKVSFQEEYAVEDDTALLAEVVVNDKLLPLPVVEIDFHMDKGLRFSDEANTAVSDRSYRRDVFALGARQKITRTLEFRCARRGYYAIGQAGLDVRSLLLSKNMWAPRPKARISMCCPGPCPPSASKSPFPTIMAACSAGRRSTTTPSSSPACGSTPRATP